MGTDRQDKRDDLVPKPDSEAKEGKSAEARHRSLDRMASMGVFAGAIVHELNNPLGITMANLTFALEELRSFDADLAETDGHSAADMAAQLAGARARIARIVDCLQEAKLGADRARLVVRDLRTFSHADDERLTTLDVRRVLESSINLAYAEIRGHARLVKDYGPIPAVMGNETKLGQVFLNLLVNAAQAVQGGDAQDSCIRVTTKTDGRRNCVVEVTDNGGGIAPENLARVFEPFFTTKEKRSTGLGLSICQHVVSAMGGQVEAESQVGTGSTFRVTLPGVAERAELDAASLRAPEAPSPRCRVLVIDDEPMMARAVQRLLDAEHDVVTSSDPLGAVEQVRAGERFDAILCDLMMPAMNGMEVYEAIARVAEEQARRMVFMTGGAFTPTIVRFLEGIENPRIEKPLEHAALRAILRAHLGEPIAR